jgi:DNA polymerase III epsilon subunit-like protein
MSDTEDVVVVIDLETTGLDPRRCAILEIGAVLLESERPMIFDRSLRYDPQGRCWEERAEAVHGLSREEATEGWRMEEEDAMQQLLLFLANVAPERLRITMAGMNPHFDRAFLDAAMDRCGLRGMWDRLVSHRMIDLHSLAVPMALKAGRPLGKLHTDGIYEMLGMEPEPKPHRALTGARLEAEAMRRLMGLDLEGGAA